MSGVVTAQPVYVLPRKRGSQKDPSLVADSKRSSSTRGGRDASSTGRKAFFSWKRGGGQCHRPMNELTFSGLHDQERETSFPSFRGPRLGWRFLM
eukprot:4150674-Pyramimonas_sp.AAC.1